MSPGCGEHCEVPAREADAGPEQLAVISATTGGRYLHELIIDGVARLPSRLNAS